MSFGMTSVRTRTRMIERLRAQGISHEGVLAAMFEVPRHQFVDEALAQRAYDESALPIGSGQFISAPYIVARMLELLMGQSKKLPKILEVGTGCGYQTALLAHLATEVYSVERIGSLLTKARQRLWSLKLSHIRLVHADGYLGLDSVAPFDGIIVAAAPLTVPETLKKQLILGARLVIPVGSEHMQRLAVIEKCLNDFILLEYDPVRFVPLVKETM